MKFVDFASLLLITLLIDHCLQWAVRKVNSLQKENHSDEEVLDFKLKATTKFYKYFITKPKKLLESFPVEESPDTWKAPRKVNLNYILPIKLPYFNEKL